MSSPGFTTAQMTPEFMQQMQQYQDQQRKMQMAQALMQNNANPQTANSGLANAGSSIMGALTMRDMQNNAAQDYRNAMPGTMHNLGGGLGSISDKTPALPKSSWMSNLFSLGAK